MNTLNLEKNNNQVTDADITHKKNTLELNNWIHNLKSIKKELINLANICNKNLTDKQNYDIIHKRFKKKEKENEALLKVLQNYAVARTNIAECEDIQCDMVYITEHKSYKQNYLYHLDKYKKFKNYLNL